jgi:hypothetical protein
LAKSLSHQRFGKWPQALCNKVFCRHHQALTGSKGRKATLQRLNGIDPHQQHFTSEACKALKNTSGFSSFVPAPGMAFQKLSVSTAFRMLHRPPPWPESTACVMGSLSNPRRATTDPGQIDDLSKPALLPGQKWPSP